MTAQQEKRKEINLLPKEKWESGTVGKLLKWVLNVGRYVVVFTELIVISAFLFRFGLDRRLTDIKEQVNNKKSVINSFGDFEEVFRRTQLQLKTVSDTADESLDMGEILNEISQMTPIDTSYTSIGINEEGVALEGQTLSDVGLATLLAKSQASKLFTGVVLENVSSAQEQSQAIEFRMVLGFKDTVEKINKDKD
ncbi:PilN domain-containing protein [Patescibacteria group bacterium]